MGRTGKTSLLSPVQRLSDGRFVFANDRSLTSVGRVLTASAYARVSRCTFGSQLSALSPFCYWTVVLGMINDHSNKMFAQNRSPIVYF